MSDWHSKKFGQLTGSQIETFVTLFRSAWSERAAWDGLSPESEKWWEAVAKIASIPPWTIYYQDTFFELVVKTAVVAGKSDALVAAIKSDDPIGALIDLADELPDEAPDHAAAMPVAFAMVGNLDAIARYSRSINDLLKEWQERLDFEALGKAISVDSSLTTVPLIQAALRMGQLTSDDSFANDVFKAVKGPHKKRLEYPELRWLEYLLRHIGAFTSCSREEIYRLLVEELRIYDPRAGKRDGKAALFALFRAWQKEAGIQNPRFGFSAKSK